MALNWMSISENCEKRAIEVLQMQGYFLGNLAVRKVVKTKNQRLISKMGKSKAIIPDIQDEIQNSLLRVVDTMSGCSGNKNDFRKFERN